MISSVIVRAKEQTREDQTCIADRMPEGQDTEKDPGRRRRWKGVKLGIFRKGREIRIDANA